MSTKLSFCVMGVRWHQYCNSRVNQSTLAQPKTETDNRYRSCERIRLFNFWRGEIWNSSSLNSTYYHHLHSWNKKVKLERSKAASGSVLTRTHASLIIHFFCIPRWLLDYLDHILWPFSFSLSQWHIRRRLHFRCIAICAENTPSHTDHRIP